MGRKLESIPELRGICQKEATDGWYAWRTTRRFSIYLTWLLLHTPVTGNQVTLVMTLAGLAMVALFAVGGHGHLVAGALLAQVYHVLDRVDGEIARYRRQASPRGAFFDRMSHMLVHPLVFAGLSFGVYSRSPSPWVFVFGYSAALFTALNMLREEVTEAVLFPTPNPSPSEADPPTPPHHQGTGSLLGRISRRIPDLGSEHVVMYALLVAAILNQPYGLLIFLGLVLPAKWGFCFLRDSLGWKGD